MNIYALPVFNGGATSAFNAMPMARTRGVQSVGAAGDLLDWRNWSNALAPLVQQSIAAELRNLGVPNGFVQGGAAIAFKARGYTFQGGTVTLRSGVIGTPMTAPDGRRYLLSNEGAEISYSPADIAASAGVGPEPSPGVSPWLVVAGAAVLYLAWRRFK